MDEQLPQRNLSKKKKKRKSNESRNPSQEHGIKGRSVHQKETRAKKKDPLPPAIQNPPPRKISRLAREMQAGSAHAICIPMIEHSRAVRAASTFSPAERGRPARGGGRGTRRCILAFHVCFHLNGNRVHNVIVFTA